MNYPNTTDKLGDALDAAGFVYADEHRNGFAESGEPCDWWELADEDLIVRVRLVATREDGLQVYGFVGRNMITSWDLRLSSSTPAPFIDALLVECQGWALARSIVETVGA